MFVAVRPVSPAASRGTINIVKKILSVCILVHPSQVHPVANICDK